LSLVGGCQPDRRSQTLLHRVVAPGTAEQKVDAREEAIIAELFHDIATPGREFGSPMTLVPTS
tara:strand:+ start:271 stop:459 length:189 start_codon:yes stop_codon:yes gene_type:complete